MAPRGHLTVSENILGCHNLGAGVGELLVLEARNAAKHPVMHRTASTSKNCPTQYGIAAKVEEPWTRGGNTGPGVRMT